MRKEYTLNREKITFNKIRYACYEIVNSWFSKTILPNKFPKQLKLTLIIDEPLDGYAELKLTSLSENYAIYNSVDITGVYIHKESLPNPAPMKLGIKWEAT